jgi:DNA-binding MarR family transcriptional regulator
MTASLPQAARRPPARQGNTAPPAARPAARPAAPDDVQRIESALVDLLRLTASVRVHEARVRAAGLRISRTQLSFLGWLAERGPTPVSKLGGWADVSQPAASRALSQLEADGYVGRSADDRDGRVNLMVLTPKGREARAKVLDLMRRQLASALDDMGVTDRRKLAELLGQLVVGLREARMMEEEN